MLILSTVRLVANYVSSTVTLLRAYGRPVKNCAVAVDDKSMGY